MALALCAAVTLPAAAQDTLKIAIGQINNWENQAPTLGQDAGIFKKYNLVLENFGTAGAGETVQAVISGSADIGGGVGLAGAMRAFSKGAPVRVILPAFTGTSDLYWYVKADSPIKSLKDATDKNTIAYSTNGSSSNNIVLAFVEELGLKAKPTATGGPPGTLTSVMTGQIDIGWAAPPFGIKEINEGKIRIIARGSDVPSLRGQTVRVLIANADALDEEEGCDPAVRQRLPRGRRLDVLPTRPRLRCTPRRPTWRQRSSASQSTSFSPRRPCRAMNSRTSTRPCRTP